MNKEFSRVRSVKDIIFSFSLIIAGSVLVALPTSVSVNILGFFMIFAGILLLIILRTGYQDIETKEIYCKKEKFFPQGCRDRMLSAVEKNIEDMDMSEEDKGNGLRMDIYYNRKSNKAFVQIFEYIPYKYEPVSPVYGYTADKISKLIK